MSLLQIVINFVLAVLAFMLVRYLLAYIGFDGAIGWIISVLAGIGVFFANFARRMVA